VQQQKIYFVQYWANSGYVEIIQKEGHCWIRPEFFHFIWFLQVFVNLMETHVSLLWSPSCHWKTHRSWILTRSYFATWSLTLSNISKFRINSTSLYLVMLKRFMFGTLFWCVGSVLIIMPGDKSRSQKVKVEDATVQGRLDGLLT
jgi:hypothetical protein